MLGILWLLPLSCAFLQLSAESTDKLVFRPLMHQPRIYAGAPPGVHVTTVHAYDPDRPRKKVEYNLPNVFDYQTFVVDQLSGNLTTAMPIEKGVGQTYEVMVAAVSLGSSELQHLQVAVTAFNQFPPRFEKRVYTIEMHPSTPVSTPVLQVNAIDPDPEPHNAEVYYKMDQNLTSKFFSLDALTGDLTLTLPFNETTKNLHFGMFAEDGGSPKRWDYVPVYVVLKNISAPVNVMVVSVTHSKAVICWEEPYYGEVLGYTVSYHLKNSPDPKLVNVTTDFLLENCQDLLGLYDDSEYAVQVYGWNERETGQLSTPVEFRTSENWCKKVHCNSGTCEPIAEDPWYLCYCPPGYSGVLCEYFDVCSTSPCGSHGQCQNITTDEYMCICDDNYIGSKCEYRNPCLEDSNPCENGGTCELIINDSFECICAEGFYGRKCKKRDPCVSDPCLNGGSCSRTFNDFFNCFCPPGFTGATCEEEINYCLSYPCAAGATCISYKGNYSCICSPGYYGHNCNMRSKCPAEKTPSVDGWYEWDATQHGSVMLLKCPFASSDSLTKDGNLKRQCFFVNGTTMWDDIDSSECTIKAFLHADEVAVELHNITKNPSSLDNELLEVAAQGIESIAVHATKDEKIAQDMVEVVSNVMEMNDTVVEQATSETFESFRKSIDDFASNVVLNPGESVSIGTENVRIQSIDWHPEIESEIDDDDHIELTAPTDKGTVVEDAKKESDITIASYPTNATENMTVAFGPTEKPKPPMFQVFVPKEALKEAHKQLEKNVRLKFVVYYNDKLFQSKTSTPPIPATKPTPATKSAFNDTESSEISEESPIRTPVLQISVGNVSLSNMQNPLVYILPMVTKKKASCVYWKEKEKKWSINGLETTQQDDKVICRSSHMTAFSVLLDFMPDDQPNEEHDMILSILSYIGSSLSILGLLATIVTYSMFRCLNRDHPGKILLNLCLSLLMMNIVFLVGSSSLVTTHNVCAAVAVCTHYFVLSSLCWMCAEAINMRHLLVHVFATSETHFMLKRFCLAWGIPFLFVVVTVAVKFEAYHNSLDYCMLSSKDPWVYYLSFLGPCCVILAANLIIFLRVSRVICTPKLAVRNAPNHTRTVTVAQIRGSFTVMVLLGVTWVFGTMAIGEVRLIFQYLFSISNSLQGFLIFLVRCLLYPEAKNAWVYLLRTGKFKTHRGIIPPGTVSFSSNSGVKNGTSPNTTLRTESTDETHSGEHRGYNRDQSSNVFKTSPQSLSTRRKSIDKHPNFHRSVNRPETELYGKRFQYHDIAHKLQYKCDSIEMQRKIDKNWKNEYNAYQSQHPSLYEGSRRNESFCYPRQSEGYSNADLYPIKVAFPINVQFEKVKLKKKHNSEANVGDHRETVFSPVRDRRALMAPSPNLQGKTKGFQANTNSNTLQDFRPQDHKALSPLEEVMNDRRRSLDVTSPRVNHRLSPKRVVVVRRMRENSNSDTIFLEVDEGVHSDAGSSSTDVDDNPYDSYRSRLRTHSVIP